MNEQVRGIASLAVGAVDFPIHSYEVMDTGKIPPDERLDWWCKHVNGNNGLDMVCRTSNFVARMRRQSLGTCQLYSLEVETPHRTIRSASQPDLCYVNIQRADDPVTYRGDREFTMRGGQMAVYQSTSGYQLDFAGRADSIVLAIPKSLLAAHAPTVDQHFEVMPQYDRHLVAMLARTCDDILGREDSMKQSVSDSLMQGVIGLVCAVLHDADVRADRPTWSQRATLQRVKAYVFDNLRNPDLNPQGIAASMGLTVNYLHKIFRHDEATVMQFAFNERLERCRRDLARSDVTGNISQIAFSWGFNDASHFTRSFRRRFGVSPREYRQAVLDQDMSLTASPPQRLN